MTSHAELGGKKKRSIREISAADSNWDALSGNKIINNAALELDVNDDISTFTLEEFITALSFVAHRVPLRRKKVRIMTVLHPPLGIAIVILDPEVHERWLGFNGGKGQLHFPKSKKKRRLQRRIYVLVRYLDVDAMVPYKGAFNKDLIIPDDRVRSSLPAHADDLPSWHDGCLTDAWEGNQNIGRRSVLDSKLTHLGPQ